MSGIFAVLLLDMAINWVGWAASVLLKTEMFYDITGTATFLVSVVGTYFWGTIPHARKIVASAMVCIWTLRLGSFLLFRAVKTGGDSRFKEALEKPGTLFIYWTLQGLWCWIVAMPVLIVNRAPALGAALKWTDIVGPVLWGTGMLLEATADIQKFKFKQDPQNKGKFIDVGLFKLARYPQYLGEMSVWWGTFIFCAGAGLSGWQYVSIVSPLFTMGLVLGLSGIPIQERQAKERWGADPAYQEYRESTNLLLPVPKLIPSRPKGHDT
ncbi:unnamed protein product [Pedinophyceae sp. YPF-701]|nr:unnamed protein product [Pedinophyceae sp. YPF-701]